jgi:hypothetical protein
VITPCNENRGRGAPLVHLAGGGLQVESRLLPYLGQAILMPAELNGSNIAEAAVRNYSIRTDGDAPQPPGRRRITGGRRASPRLDGRRMALPAKLAKLSATQWRTGNPRVITDRSYFPASITPASKLRKQLIEGFRTANWCARKLSLRIRAPGSYLRTGSR